MRRNCTTTIDTNCCPVVPISQLLGAPKYADQDELKKVYKKAALKWHPDRWSNKSEAEQATANETFQKINRAFEVLSDKEKRARYSNGLVLRSVKGHKCRTYICSAGGVFASLP